MKSTGLQRRVSKARRTVLVAIPVCAAFALVGVAILYGYTPVDYAANYTPVRNVTEAWDTSPFAAIALPGGGTAISDLDMGTRLTYRQFDSAGRLVQQTLLER